MMQAPPGLPLGCRTCGAWSQGCRTAVMRGYGPLHADVCVVGEYPGYAEDMQGTPWVGPTGRFIRDRFAAHGIDPNRVFWTNAIRCKLPLKTKPTADQLAACRGFFDAEHVTVKPRMLLVCGTTAARSLLKISSMDEARATVHTYNGTLAVATYNPAGGFRDSHFAHAFDQDLNRLVRGLNGDLIRPQTTHYKVVRTLAEVRDALADLRRARFKTLDLETAPMHPWGKLRGGERPKILCFVMSGQARTAYVFPWAHPQCQPDPEEQPAIWAELKAFIEDPANAFVLQGGIFDQTWLYAFGIRIANYFGDTLLGSYLLNETAPSHSLTRLVWDYTDIGDYWSEMEAKCEATETQEKKDARARVRDLRKAAMKGELDWDDAEEEIEAIENVIDLGFTYDRIDWNDLWFYAGRDGDATYRIWERMETQLREEGLFDLLQAVYCTASRTFARMQLNGTLYDTARAVRTHDYLVGLERETIAKIRSLPKVKEYEATLQQKNNEVRERRKSGTKGLKLHKGDDEGYLFNPAAPKQIGEFFYHYLRLPVPDVQSKHKEKETTSIEALKLLEKHSAVAKHVGKLRKVQKYDRTYIKPVPDWLGNDGRVHTTFLLFGTRTGRPSSRRPNLLNIPREGDPTAAEYCIPSVKEHWISRFKNGWIGEVDLSQIEVRIAANLSGDPNLLAIFQAGGDVHRATAARVFRIPVNEVTDTLRQRAKKIVFAMTYGAQAGKIATLAECTEQEAQEFIEGYLREFPMVRAYMLAQARKVCTDGWVQTLTGQKRRLYTAIGQFYNQEDRQVSEAIRQAINSPVQGTAAHVAITGVNKLDEILWKNDLLSLIISEVYDSAVLDIHPRELMLIAKIAPKVMESLSWPWLKVPLVADFKVGRTWGSAHEFRVVGNTCTTKLGVADLEEAGNGRIHRLPVPAQGNARVKVTTDGRPLLISASTEEDGQIIRFPYTSTFNGKEQIKIEWEAQAA